MKRRKRLTEVEWEIMEGVWKLGRRVIAREVHSHLYPGEEKSFSTVQTMLNILADKGFLQKEKIGKINFFTPLVSRDEAGHQETRSLVSRIFGGSFGAMANFMVKEPISRKELEELKAMIEERERALGRKKK
jgi:BlaI family penicillinase repressor